MEGDSIEGEHMNTEGIADFQVECERPIQLVVEELRRYRRALNTISKVAGNLPDDRLTSRTGPNDAVHRGLMVVQMRDIAIHALCQ